MKTPPWLGLEYLLLINPRDGTVPLDDTFTETVEYHGRTFQKYALANKVYFLPVDEVCHTELPRLLGLTDHC
jgi:hypothetical protein